jgi:hypothetical protein
VEQVRQVARELSCRRRIRAGAGLPDVAWRSADEIDGVAQEKNQPPVHEGVQHRGLVLIERRLRARCAVLEILGQGVLWLGEIDFGTRAWGWAGGRSALTDDRALQQHCLWLSEAQRFGQARDGIPMWDEVQAALEVAHRPDADARALGQLLLSQTSQPVLPKETGEGRCLPVAHQPQSVLRPRRYLRNWSVSLLRTGADAFPWVRTVDLRVDPRWPAHGHASALSPRSTVWRISWRRT